MTQLTFLDQLEIKKLSNEKLLEESLVAKSNETKATEYVLWILDEIESRKLYLNLGYQSLWEFCTRHQKYSAGSAQRRIDAMRLLKVMPEIKEKLEEGKMTLTTLHQMKVFINRQQKESCEELKLEDKKEILSLIENKTQKEVELEFIKLNPEVAISMKEKERQVTEELTEFKYMAKSGLKSKLEALKGFYSHVNPNPTHAELIELLADTALKYMDPARKNVRTQKTQATQSKTPQSKASQPKGGPTNPSKGGYQSKEISNNQPGVTPKNQQIKNTRYIPPAIKKAVWIRDQGCCAYVDPNSKRRCSSKHMVEHDHINPFALGGETTVENLRLLCRAHNQWRAQKTFNWRRQV